MILKALLLIIFIKELVRNKNRLSFIIDIYFKQGFIVYIKSLLIVALLITTSYYIYDIIPSWMKWTWLNWFIDGNTSGILGEPFKTDKDIFGYIYLVIFSIVIIMCLPYFAEWEENTFRKNKLTIIQGITSSISFGLIHVVMGIPIVGLIIVTVVGFLYWINYIYLYRKKGENIALLNNISLHTIYNLIVVFILIFLNI